MACSVLLCICRLVLVPESGLEDVVAGVAGCLPGLVPDLHYLQLEGGQSVKNDRPCIAFLCANENDRRR